MWQIDLDDFYDTVQEIKTQIKNLDSVRTEDVNLMKTIKTVLQANVDYFDAVLEDNNICPLCGGEILRELSFHNDNGYRTTEVTYKCEHCGQEYPL